MDPVVGNFINCFVSHFVKEAEEFQAAMLQYCLSNEAR